MKKSKGKSGGQKQIYRVNSAQESFPERTGAAQGRQVTLSDEEQSSDRDLLVHERAADRLASLWEARRPTVIQEKKKQRPGWLWPLLALLAILLAVFLFVPLIIDRSLADRERHLDAEEGPRVETYGPDVRVVTQPVVDLFAEPDLKSERLGQVLYNTPVQLSEAEAGQDFCKVTLLNGQAGYVLARHLTKDHQSVEPELYRQKLVVTDLTKRIMSHADKGTLLVEVKRGTVLYVLYDGKDLFRVQLPTGGEGWVSSGGLSVLPVKSSLPVTDANRFVATALTYDKTRWIPHGKTNDGIDLYGVIQQAALVNGVDLPADYNELYQLGETVEGAVLDKDGLEEGHLQPGDVFFCERIKTYDDDGSPVIDPEQRRLAIWIGQDQFLTESVREFAITRHETDVLLKNWHILRVARYFPTLDK